MFTALHAVILGLVEGITEFLPISSTGHMILTARALSITETEFLKSFQIIIQLGAICAVFVLYWRKLLLNGKIFKRIAIAFVPTVIIGLSLYKIVKTHLLGSTSVVLWALAIGGVLLIIFEFAHKEKPATEASVLAELESISYPRAFLIGMFQAVAIIPGVSRSASTIVGGLLLGVSRVAIVEFSFMLAVPTMAAATLLDLVKSGGTFGGQEVGLLAIGFVTAFVSALFAVKFLLRFIKNHTFIPFGVYRIVIALAFLLYLV